MNIEKELDLYRQFNNKMLEALIRFLKEKKAELEKKGLVPTLEEAITNLESMILPEDHDCKIGAAGEGHCDHPSHKESAVSQDYEEETG